MRKRTLFLMGIALVIASGPVFYVMLYGDRTTYVPPAEVMQGQSSATPADRVRVETRTTRSPETAVADLLTKLPRTVTISGREVIVDTESVASSTRSMYVALPYTVVVMGESEMVASDVSVRRGEDVISFITRLVDGRMPREEILARYAADQFQAAVSVYELSDDLTSGDIGATGVSLYIRRQNLPDERVIGREDRFDLVYGTAGWEVVWHGERTYCQSDSGTAWQPASELCQ